MNEIPGSIDRTMTEGLSVSEIADIGTIAYVANLSGHARPRSPGELAGALEQRPANSIEEACSGHRIEGHYLDADGKRRTASIAIVDDTTFTPEGLTFGDPELYDTYAGFLVARHLMGIDAAGLSDDERDQLGRVVAQLEAAIGAPEDE